MHLQDPLNLSTMYCLPVSIYNLSQFTIFSLMFSYSSIMCLGLHLLVSELGGIGGPLISGSMFLPLFLINFMLLRKLLWNIWSKSPAISPMKQLMIVWNHLLYFLPNSRISSKFQLLNSFHLKSRKTFTSALRSHYIISSLVCMYNLLNNQLKAIKTLSSSMESKVVPARVLKIKTESIQVCYNWS